MADPGIVDVYSRGRSGGELTLTEYQQFYVTVRATLTSHEDTFFQHQNDLIDDAAFESSRAVLRRILSFPGTRALWKRQRATFEKSFRDSIDQVLSEVAAVDPRAMEEEVATWHQDVAGELAKLRA